MIKRAKDYKFVTGLDDIKIDGGIMPLRDDPDELRGEDIAFLGEAKAELLVLSGADENPETISMEDTSLWASRVNEVCAEGYWSGNCLCADTSASSAVDELPFTLLSVNDFEEVPRVSPGGELKKSVILNAIQNVKKIGSVLRYSNGVVTQTVTNYNYSFQAQLVDPSLGPVDDLWADRIEVVKKSWLLSYSNYDTIYSGTSRSGYEYVSLNEVTGGTVTYDIAKDIPYNLISAAYGFMKITGLTTNYDASGTPQEERHYKYIPALFSGKRISFDLADLLRAGRDLIAETPVDHSVNRFCELEYALFGGILMIRNHAIY